MSKVRIDIAIEDSIGVMGSAIKITAILNEASPTSVKITIEDSSGLNKVTSADMILDVSKVYTYIWQSTDDIDTAGTYDVIVDVVSGGYTSRSYKTFEMIDITD